MLERWNDAPGWLLGVTYGAPVAVLTLLVLGLGGHGWDVAAVVAVAVGGVCGVVAGPWARRVRAVLEEAEDARQSGGASPRAAASGNRPRPTLLLVLAAGSVYVALTGSPWWFAVTGVFVVLLVVSLLGAVRGRAIDVRPADPHEPDARSWDAGQAAEVGKAGEALR